ncbi:MAG: hypothetical protein HFE53_04345 [Turicibacter sp.]|nr:hypothetical protein [Turicibacter sp.]
MHFTEIKALLNPNYRQKKKIKESILGKIFLEDDEINEELLKSFYDDVLSIIENHNFTVVVTGKKFIKNKVNSYMIEHGYNTKHWHTLFKMHLDNLAYYMQEISYQKSLKDHQTKLASKTKKTKPKMDYNILTTKLRYDGDFGLSCKNELRDAFSQIITVGTQNFTSKFTTQCFDNLKFIDKLEVGSYESCPTCKFPKVSHAGSEIVDFIALYASNGECREIRRSDLIHYESYSKSQANKYVNRSLTISIGNNLIKPYNKIQNKIFKHTN